MGKINVTIDGRPLQVEEGQSVLAAAEANGIHIPVLCHHPSLPPEGVCRVCLVEVTGQRNLQPACIYPVAEGMEISTHSPKTVEARRFALELIVSDHPLDCMTCEATGDCLLQDLAYEYQVRVDAFPGGRRNQYAIDDPNPFIQVDRNKCILCRRCIRACDMINGVEAISVVQRGIQSKIAFGMDSTMEDSPCEFCGSCVEVCPTGALWPKMSIGKARPWQVKKVRTTCSYCGVGCQLLLHVYDNEIVRVTAADGPSNRGFTCVKGRFGYDFVNHPDRLNKPRVRRYLLEGKKKPEEVWAAPSLTPEMDFVEVDWDRALDLVSGKWSAIQKRSGSDAFAALASAKCTNEENYLIQKLSRQVIGTHNVDHCARL